MGGILNTLLSPTIGIPAYFAKLLDVSKESTIYIMGNESTWLIAYVLAEIWKNAGWGSIVYMAAISNINPELYEAAKIDGANRLQMMWYITIKQIRVLIVCMFILKLGKILSINFEQVYALQNNMILSVGEVFSTYEYKIGLGKTFQYSYSATIGLFQGLVGLVTLFFSNKIVKRISGGEFNI
jgi:putative aldouronate transport system permease protein